MWTLLEALDLVRRIQTHLKPMQYHVLLGGGVLNNGKSEKDLDLYVVPFGGQKSTPMAILSALYEILGPGVPLSGDDYPHGGLAPWREAFKYTLNGKRIDVFIQ